MPPSRARVTRSCSNSSVTLPTSKLGGNHAAPRAKTGTPFSTKRKWLPPSGSGERSRATVRSPTRPARESRTSPSSRPRSTTTSWSAGSPRSCVHQSSASGTRTTTSARPSRTGATAVTAGPWAGVRVNRTTRGSSVAKASTSAANVTTAVPSACTASVRTWCPRRTAARERRSSTGSQTPTDGTRGPKSHPQENVALRRRVARARSCDRIPSPPASPGSASSPRAPASRAMTACALSGTPSPARGGENRRSRTCSPPRTGWRTGWRTG